MAREGGGGAEDRGGGGATWIRMKREERGEERTRRVDEGSDGGAWLRPRNEEGWGGVGRGVTLSGWGGGTWLMTRQEEEAERYTSSVAADMLY